MKKLAWVTDIHLDFLDRSEVERFCAEISRVDPDLLLVGGDIGQADSVFGYLEKLAESLNGPVCFVFGNHDYYNGSIAEIRSQALEITRRVPDLICLESAGAFELTRSTVLVGHGGWGDGRLGDYDRSPVDLNDFHKIRELQGLDRGERLKVLHRLGDEAADYLLHVATEAFSRFDDLIVLTHVPPFKEACLYRGKIGGPDWLPFFTCDAVGRVLKKLMQQNPEKRMRVLCGHSHHAAFRGILPNLSVHTGGAVYGSPAVQDVLSVD